MKSYQSDCEAFVPQIRGTEGSKCPTQAVASGYNTIAWISGNSISDRRQNARPSLKPRPPESLMDCAAGADIRGYVIEVDVCEPVADRLAATE